MKDNEEKTYEELSEELAVVTQRLSQETVDLEEMVSLYEAGMKLSQECLKRLDAYEARIRAFEEQNSTEENRDV